MKFNKVVSIILIVLLCLTVVSCTKDEEINSGNKGQGTEEDKKPEESKKGNEIKPDEEKSDSDGKLFDKPFEISMLYGDQPSWPYKEDWYVKKTIEEKTGVKLKVLPVETSAITDKVNMIMASGELPDIIAHLWMPQVKQYALQGAYVDIGENMEKTPNFGKWAEENKEHVQKFYAADGNLYSFPNYGIGITNTRFWFYRKDIFDKYDLVPPKNSEELYDVLKILKEKEPEAYPFNYRELGNLIASWDTSGGFYYNEESNEWSFGPIEDNHKELIEFLSKLYAEGLIPPDIYSMDAKAWTDMMVQGKTFITFDYVGRVEGLLEAGKKLDSEYDLAYMPPLNGKFPYSPVEYSSTTISKEGRNDEKIDNLLKYMDWFYTNEAQELLSWGEEGVTYKLEDGKRKFIEENYRAAYGIGNVGWFGVLDQEAIKSTYPEVCIGALNEQPNHELKENLVAFLSLTDEEQEIIGTVGSSINKYAAENTAHFVIGEKSMDEWDNFVGSVKAMDLDKVLDVYRTAHKRLLDATK